MQPIPEHILQGNVPQLNLQPQPLPLTTLQMMKQSTIFKVCFVGTILFLISSGILSIVGANTYHHKYSSCSYTYYNYPNRCYDGWDYYCCKSDYSYCGQSGKCYYQDYYYATNWGVYIASYVCSGLALCLCFVVTIMFCNFKRRSRMGLFNPGMNNLNNNYFRH